MSQVVALGLACLALLAPRCAQAQLPKSPSAQIFLDGVLQAATLDPLCKASPTCGGTLKVNNEIVVVPKNLLVMLPANALTWQEMFIDANVTKPITGLALEDPPSPAGVTYTVSVAANQVNGKIIAALVDFGQSPIVGGAGYIDGINYTTGELMLAMDGAGGGAAVRLNDPQGRYGMVQKGPGFDGRFCVDPENPTVAAATGFPMCIPRWDPAGPGGTDPFCPDTTSQRPLDAAGNPATIIQMAAPGSNPDPLVMVPFKKGDYISFAGVLTSGGFIAAYEVSNNVAIYTQKGVDPAFANFEAAIMGTGGLNVLGAGEAAIRSRFEGFTTDPSRPIELFAMDFSPKTGKPSPRSLGQVMPDPGAPLGSVRGRWRFRPPCTIAGPLSNESAFFGNKGCTPPPAGVYTPPPREVMATIVDCTPRAVSDGGVLNLTSGSGAGCSYRNPAIEYIWPENVPGTPIVESNFQAVPFLTQGGYTSSLGSQVGTLDPWPSNHLPADSCLAPNITTGGPYHVSAGGAVTMSAAVTGPGAPFGYAWTADEPLTGGQSLNAADLSASFSPVKANASYTFNVTNMCGNTFSASVHVYVVDTPKQAVQAIAPITVKQGLKDVSLTAVLSAAGATDLFVWTFPPDLVKKWQSADPAARSTVTFDAPVLTPGTVDPKMYSVSVHAGSGLTQSAEVSTSITVMPPPDTVTITSVVFRCDKHRMIVTATSSITSAALTMTLNNYVSNANKVYITSTLGNNLVSTGGGIFSITIEPVPMPSTTIASLSVTSSLGGSVAKRLDVTTDVKGTCTI